MIQLGIIIRSLFGICFNIVWSTLFFASTIGENHVVPQHGRSKPRVTSTPDDCWATPKNTPIHPVSVSRMWLPTLGQADDAPSEMGNGGRTNHSPIIRDLSCPSVGARWCQVPVSAIKTFRKFLGVPTRLRLVSTTCWSRNCGVVGQQQRQCQCQCQCQCQGGLPSSSRIWNMWWNELGWATGWSIATGIGT